MYLEMDFSTKLQIELIDYICVLSYNIQIDRESILDTVIAEMKHLQYQV